MKERPILFNTEMVKAILDGRKTCTRRAIKFPNGMTGRPIGKAGDNSNPLGVMYPGGIKRPPYQLGDILYVRETWFKDVDRYMYRANYSDQEKFYRDSKEIEMKWKPSIHMPKEAARIWLKVTDVKVEQLQEMDKTDALKEGIDPRLCLNLSHALTKFKKIWDSTIKKSDLDIYGWDADPWVWVIEFERCEKPGKEQ